MFKRLFKGKGSKGPAALDGKRHQLAETKEADEEAHGHGGYIRTPATEPLEELQQLQHAGGGGGVPRVASDASARSGASEYFDAQELYADNFKLKRQAAKMREELSQKRFREAQLAAALEEASEERARLEERLMGFVETVHERDVRLARLTQEKAEAEALLQALADYHASQEQEEKEQEEGKGKGGGLLASLARLRGGRVGSGPGGPPLHGRLLYALCIAAAPGVGLLLLLLLAAAAFPTADHRVLGGLGGLLLDPRSAFWRTRASGLASLGPAGGVLQQGEYLRSCRPLVWGLARPGCGAAHVLHLGHDGNLVVYRGHSPLNHGGAVWATGPVSSYQAAAAAVKGGDTVRYRALVDAKGVLKVVKEEVGKGGKGKEWVVFSRPVSRLPPDLVRLGVVEGK
jgi:hypothetical protein